MLPLDGGVPALDEFRVVDRLIFDPGRAKLPPFEHPRLKGLSLCEMHVHWGKAIYLLLHRDAQVLIFGRVHPAIEAAHYPLHIRTVTRQEKITTLGISTCHAGMFKWCYRALCIGHFVLRANLINRAASSRWDAQVRSVRETSGHLWAFWALVGFKLRGKILYGLGDQERMVAMEREKVAIQRLSNFSSKVP
ncbi:hypothetical protein CPC08DRAFT_267189 [Agrocybe pediades]|nr:hypothetical protein CPC08DRAFT_267189 [Agrocybe pediades]